MAIENLTFNQDETTKDMTTVTVTFKQINSIDVAATKVALAPVPASQRSEVKNQGNTKNQSIAAGLFDTVTSSFKKLGQ
jgi:Tfp pilus assembly protein PilW